MIGAQTLTASSGHGDKCGRWPPDGDDTYSSGQRLHFPPFDSHVNLTTLVFLEGAAAIWQKGRQNNQKIISHIESSS